MRRGILAIVGTVAGTALMLGAKLGTAPPTDPAAALADDGTPAAGDPSGASNAATPGPTAPSTPAASPSGSVGPTPSAGTKTPPPPTTKPPTGGLKDGTYTGSGTDVTRYRYTLTVSITVSGGRITAGRVDCGSAY